MTGSGTHVLVLPGGGYSTHAPHEAEPIVEWLEGLGVRAGVFRYPLHARHPVPLEALRREIRRRRDGGADRIGIAGFSAGGHLAGLAALAAGSDEHETVDFVVMGYPIWHTAEDIYVPPEHTYRLARALAANDVAHTVHVFAHGPHSLGLARGAGDAEIWTTLAASWIAERIAPDVAQAGGRQSRRSTASSTAPASVLRTRGGPS